MATFEFNGTYITVGAVSGGIAQGHGGKGQFSAAGAIGVGFALNAFSFKVPCECADFEKGDYITVSSVTLAFATKMSITYRLCGGTCNGSLSYWTGGLGLGISGVMRFDFSP
jgi:hypothetical protein